MSKMDDIGGVAAAALDASEGVMEVLQVLVVALAATGALDTAEYARLLAEWRQAHTANGSLQAVFMERMLAVLVDDPGPLMRRAMMRLVSEDAADPGL